MEVPEIVTSRARRWVHRLLTTLESMPVAREQLLDLMREGQSFEADAVPAIIEATESEDDGKALVASWILLVIAEYPEWSLAENIVGRAESAVRRCLAEGPDDLRRLACYFLRLGGVRDTLLEPLKSLIGNRDEEASLAAAGAVVQLDARCDAACAVLRNALENDNDVNAALAASDLLRAGHFDDAVVQRVRARLPHLSEVGVWTVLTAIKYSSKPAIAFFDVVAVIAAKRKASPEVRRIAASVVGRIGQGRVEAERVLLNALKTSDWRIVEGVVEGFVAIGGFPRKAGERLVALLSSADDSMRIAAARGLQAMKADAGFAVPSLVKQLKSESNIDACASMAMAIAATGPSALPALLRIIETRNVRTAEFAMRALATLGEAAAEAMAQQFSKSDDGTIRKLLVITLASMGPNATPAVPLLAQLLDETDDDELAMYVAMGLFGTGKNAVPAMDALVRCVADDRPEVVRDWAERALGAIGSDAVVALRHAASRADDRRRNLLDSALTRLSSLDDQRFKDLELFANDNMLDSFAHIAEFIDKHGSTGFPTLSKVFDKTRDAEGGITFPTSPRALLMSIEKLEEYFGFGLYRRQQGQKGVITPEGMKLLARVKDYLATKRRRLG